MKLKNRICLVFFLIPVVSFSQNGIIKGKVLNSETNEPVPFANVVVPGTSIGTSADLNGNFELKNVAPGFTNISVSSLGFKTQIYRDIQVTNAKPATVQVLLEPSASQINEVVIEASPFNKTEESPISLRTVGIAEIERNPGGNRDISNVLKSFPGVASTPAFRNDIIIRGGAPSENRFFLDGIEVPVINHFQTQGASGGPVGIINVNLVREVNFYSGAFPSARGNALSSVLEFNQVDGSSDKWKYRVTLGSSDAGFTAQGPVGKKATFIGSARASYLQWLFKALRLPFLPTFYDYQFKWKIKFDPQNELSIISLGALDRFKLNLKDNETELQRYQLNILPVNNQWNYTIGLAYRHFGKKGNHLLVASRNMLDNKAFKYADNDETNEAGKLLDYRSREIENKLRYEYNYRVGTWKISAGSGFEYARYTNYTFSKFKTFTGVDSIEFNSNLDLYSGALFVQVSKTLFKERLTLSLGARTDFNSFNAPMGNPLNQISPRFSASVKVVEWMNINANIGRYYQRPQYTLMGFRDKTGVLANKANDLKYIRADHAVAGLEFLPTVNTRITLEGFYKHYANYPFNLRDSISLANEGANFGVVGNVPADSRGKGRAYGAELLVQQKLYKGFYGILAYTFVVSEFTDKNGRFVPSSWDNRHILTLTAGYKIKGNWEFGVRWRYLAGQPFTPYDTALSVIIPVFNITGSGIPDINRLNTLRSRPFHQLDIRIDKSFFFKKWSLNLYLDIQNVYNFKFKGQDFLTIERDDAGNGIQDPDNPGRYVPKFLPNRVGTIIPTLGFVIDF
jgi:outer membrane receptor for ferrienterochelin and colicin